MLSKATKKLLRTDIEIWEQWERVATDDNMKEYWAVLLNAVRPLLGDGYTPPGQQTGKHPGCNGIPPHDPGGCLTCYWKEKSE